jgi:hypothetical protein
MKRVILLIVLAITMMLTTNCKKESKDSNSPSAPSVSVPQQGKAVFWYNSFGSDATVILNGQTQYVTTYYPSYDPDCGSSGCANFTLNVGTYNWSAASSFNTWQGTITITANGCTKMLLQ